MVTGTVTTGLAIALADPDELLLVATAPGAVVAAGDGVGGCAEPPAQAPGTNVTIRQQPVSRCRLNGGLLRLTARALRTVLIPRDPAHGALMTTSEVCMDHAGRVLLQPRLHYGQEITRAAWPLGTFFS